MKRILTIALLSASLLAAKDRTADPTYTATTTEHVRHSHKKMWISIGIVVGAGVLAGTLGNRPRQAAYQTPAATPDLKLITCNICSGTAK